MQPEMLVAHILESQNSNESQNRRYLERLTRRYKSNVSPVTVIRSIKSVRAQLLLSKCQLMQNKICSLRN